MKKKKDELYSLFKFEVFREKECLLKWGDLPDKILIVLEGKVEIYRKIGTNAMKASRVVNWQGAGNRMEQQIGMGMYGARICEKEVTFSGAGEPLFMIGDETDLC